MDKVRKQAKNKGIEAENRIGSSILNDIYGYLRIRVISAKLGYGCGY